MQTRGLFREHVVGTDISYLSLLAGAKGAIRIVAEPTRRQFESPVAPKLVNGTVIDLWLMPISTASVQRKESEKLFLF